ncbi:MAG: outer membrane protein assembly factor BamB family protein [Thermoleophilia bacterium]
MFCPECGKDNAAGARFCAGCGAGFKVGAEVDEAAESAPKKSIGQYTPYFAAAVLVLAVIAAFGYYGITRGESSEADATPAQTGSVSEGTGEGGPDPTLDMFRGGARRTGDYKGGGQPSSNKKWQFVTKGQSGSSPVIADGKAFFSTYDGSLYGVDNKDGEGYWKVENMGAPVVSVAVSKGMVFTAKPEGNPTYDNKTLFALDSSTGKEKWKFSGASINNSPAVEGNSLYFGSSNGSYYSVDVDTGKENWHYNTGDRPVNSSPAVADGVVYFGGGWYTAIAGTARDTNTNLYAVDALTGAEKWKVATSEGVASTPVVVDGLVVYGGWDDQVHAVDATNGSEVWTFKPGGQLFYNVAVSDGTVYLQDMYYQSRGNGAYVPPVNILYAIDLKTGSEKWRFTSGNILLEDEASGSNAFRHFGTPSVADGVVYFGSIDRNFYAVDAASGQEKWKFRTSYRMHVTPSIADGVVYFFTNNRNANGGSGGGILYALGGSGSEPPAPAESDADIRAVDWKTKMKTDGEYYNLGQLLFSDLDGDGSEEALVSQYPVMGHVVNYFVYGYEGSVLTLLFEQQKTFDAQLELGTEPGTFIEKTSAPGPNNPSCCPDNFRVKTYEWSPDSKTFRVIDEKLVPNPDASTM